MRANLIMTVVVANGTDLAALAALSERLFNFLADDPDNLFPEITEVETYDEEVLP